MARCAPMGRARRCWRAWRPARYRRRRHCRASGRRGWPEMAALVAADVSLAPPNVAFPTRYGRPIAWGWAVVALCFGGLALWSALAPLGAAVIAAGTVAVDGSRKSVQHLEGGIVRQILVRDGDAVAAGQILVRLDETVQQNALALVQGKLDADLATEARLVA